MYKFITPFLFFVQFSLSLSLSFPLLPQIYFSYTYIYIYVYSLRLNVCLKKERKDIFYFIVLFESQRIDGILQKLMDFNVEWNLKAERSMNDIFNDYLPPELVIKIDHYLSFEDSLHFQVFHFLLSFLLRREIVILVLNDILIWKVSKQMMNVSLFVQ